VKKLRKFADRKIPYSEFTALRFDSSFVVWIYISKLEIIREFTANHSVC
jgi:hypothetical protein